MTDDTSNKKPAAQHIPQNIPAALLKPYDPASTEDRIYELWEKSSPQSGYFNPDNLPERNQKGDPFSIVLPPPNVTGTLHIGHAAMLAIEDIMIRYARMQGKKTLWLPGTDHAAIATQSKVEGIIYKEEKKRRHDLGREEFLKRVEKFAQESHDTIVNQVRKMGSSIDWSREAFTLDEKRNIAVRTAFKKMYDDGLIYRGHRIVNWDPKGQTTVSDDEVDHTETKGKIYTFKYSKDFPIAIATTRPETKVGDVAVAVHPDDTRYQQYIGKEYKLEFAGVPLTIKIVGDEAVEKEFGTGAVGVTPAHSTIDWDIATRHSLPIKQVINEYGKMIDGLGEVSGKKTTEARELIVEWLKKEGLLEKEEDVTMNITTAERTGGVIEPLPKLQWFIGVTKEFNHNGKTTTLKQLMHNAVEKDGIKILPDRFEKTYFSWIDNLRDWCISRQIWYGHRIPVWYRTTDGKEEVYCGTEAPHGSDWKQDEDTLDTWFSSGLWTFSTLGWPDEKEFAKMRMYHPTSVLETGYDIIFFWVARMILMSTYILGEIPFQTVYLHGLVRDGQGRKMSKSLGNIIDPLEMIKKYGADATRLSLIIGTGPGNDTKLSEDKVKGYKNFANKLWNITRFVLGSTEGHTYEPEFTAWSTADIQYNNELTSLLIEVTKEMNEYKFYLVGEKLYHYTWHTFADKILEESKAIFANKDASATADQKSRAQFLLHTLYTLLKTLHPFMPFVTEEIWGLLPSHPQKQHLIVENWPA